VALFFWARWLRRRTTAPRYGAWTAYALLAPGVGMTIDGLVVHGFVLVGAIGSAASPADRSRILANGISEVIWNQAVTTIIDVIVTFWLLLVTWRWHWTAKR